ncbi:MAG: hypothetical protein LC799_23530 [Actinobacteria bacterium]|nr:hypothetical protein [Actinomycetota bacterium]
MAVSSLESEVDARVIEVQVAGPAALIVAKCHKLGERFRADGGRRLVAKDAGDVFRLIYETEVKDAIERTRRLLADSRSAASTRKGLEYLEDLFSAPRRRGVQMAIEALGTEADPDEITTVVPAYVASLLRATSSAGPPS